ncbi:Nitrogen permease regulator-like 3 [Podila humilis]|nr:Nitrogen permease regulator-like 3 [Podila humilis]
MNGLVGIIIVTNSSRGHHFVYKYPREPKSPVNINVSESLSRNNTRDVKAKPMHQHKDEFQTTSKVLGYDPQFLANLLSPKLALCDKRFQLTVDDLTFIGHPVSLTSPEFRQQRELLKRARPPKRQVKRGWVVGGTAPFMDDDDSDSDYFQDSDMEEETEISVKDVNNNSINSTKDGALIRRGSKEDPETTSTSAARSQTDTTSWRAQRFRSQTYNSPIPVSSAVASTNSGIGQGALQQQQTTIAPLLSHQPSFSSLSSLLHHPVSVPQTPTGRGVQGYHLGIPPIQINNSSSPPTPSTHFQNMSFFHVVFVIKPDQLQLNTVADQVYKNIACKLTAALRYEELNSNYVSQEATKILTIREEAAQAVRHIYDGISADKVCHVVLNDSIDISLQIPHLAPLPRASSHRRIQNGGQGDSPTTAGANNSANNNCGGGSNQGNSGQCNHTSSYATTGNGVNNQQALMTPMVTTQQYWGIGGMGSMMDDYEMGYAYEYENFPVLFPYHTLLLLEDPEEILKEIPLDANPTLVKLVQILVPYQCLDELQYILDCSMAQIYRLASHLIYWRKAKLIDQIRISNVYVVAPQAGVNESVVTEFSQHFPTLSLPTILHELSTPKAYKAHIPGAGKDKEVQTLYLEMLTYLIRKDLVVQLHTYILILVPEYIKIGCSQGTYEHMLSEENMGGSLTPTLESPIHNGATLPSSTNGNFSDRTTTVGGQAGSAKSADFAHARQQQQVGPTGGTHQQTMPSQTYRYHNRSSTGPGQTSGGSTSAVAGGGGGGMSSSLKSNLSASGVSSKLAGKRQDASSILPNPGQASEMEREWIMRMCENQPQSVHRLFMRLIHYFDGQHHVEEILFREQIVAKDLKTVLTAFREFLILTWA